MKDSLLQTRFWRIALPLLVGVGVLLVWQLSVTAFDVPSFVLPAPTLIAKSLVANFGSLMGSLFVTLRITIAAAAFPHRSAAAPPD